MTEDFPVHRIADELAHALTISSKPLGRAKNRGSIQIPGNLASIDARARISVRRLHLEAIRLGSRGTSFLSAAKLRALPFLKQYCRTIPVEESRRQFHWSCSPKAAGPWLAARNFSLLHDSEQGVLGRFCGDGQRQRGLTALSLGYKLAEN